MKNIPYNGNAIPIHNTFIMIVGKQVIHGLSTSTKQILQPHNNQKVTKLFRGGSSSSSKCAKLTI